MASLDHYFRAQVTFFKIDALFLQSNQNMTTDCHWIKAFCMLDCHRYNMMLKTCQSNGIEIKNNKAMHNLSNVKHHQMAFQSVDGAVVGNFLEPLGQTKVMHSHYREIT